MSESLQKIYNAFSYDIDKKIDALDFTVALSAIWNHYGLNLTIHKLDDGTLAIPFILQREYRHILFWNFIENIKKNNYGNKD